MGPKQHTLADTGSALDRSQPRLMGFVRALASAQLGLGHITQYDSREEKIIAFSQKYYM